MKVVTFSIRHWLAVAQLFIGVVIGHVQANDLPEYGLPRAQPETVGMSAERLARIAPPLQQFIDQREVPGVLTVIARHGKVVHVGAQGYADVENNIPLRPDHIFRLFSMTKPITAVAVMMLYEEGRFFLNDPIADYLPEFAHMKVCDANGVVNAKSPITIKQLLTHTAGFTYQGLHPNPECGEVAGEALERISGITLEQHVKKLATAPLIAQPGTEWTYGEAMAVLARLVEVLSGQRYGDFLRQRIFKPLGMTDTGYHVPGEKRQRLVKIYEQNAQRKIVAVPADGYGGDYGVQATLEGGGAGLAGTAADYVRFAQMLLNGGELDGVRLLGPTTVNLIVSNHLGPKFGDMPLMSLPHPMAQSRGLGFGFCGLVVTDPIAAATAGSKGEYSWGGWANTDFWIDPQQQLVALVFTQVIPNHAQLTTRPKFHQLAYQAIVGK